MRMQIIFYRDGEFEFPPGSPIVPEAFQSVLLPYAEQQWTPGPYGGLITQQISGEEFILTIYDFFIGKEVTLVPSAVSSVTTFVFVMEGSISFTLKDLGNFNLQQSSNYLLFLTKGVRHRAHFLPGKYRMVVFSVSPAVLSGLAKDYPILQNLVDKLEANGIKESKDVEAAFTPRTWALLYELLNYIPSDGNLNSFVHQKIVDLVLQYIKSVLQPVKTKNAFTPDLKSLARRLLDVKKLIDEHKGKRMTIELLARRSATNSKQLKHDFNKMFQITIGRYQLQKRMQLAIELLTNSSLSIDEIADKIGYDDRSSFTRKFKALYKLTPHQYRARMKQES